MNIEIGYLSKEATKPAVLWWLAVAPSHYFPSSAYPGENLGGILIPIQTLEKVDDDDDGGM